MDLKINCSLGQREFNLKLIFPNIPNCLPGQVVSVLVILTHNLLTAKIDKQRCSDRKRRQHSV